MKTEKEFLNEIIKEWDKTQELMSGCDGVIYHKIQNRLKSLEE